MSSISTTEFKQKLDKGFYGTNQLKDIAKSIQGQQKISASSQIKLQMIEEFLSVGKSELPSEDFDGYESLAETCMDARIAKKYLHIMKSARNRGLEFNLTLSDVKTLCNKKKCHYTGLAFNSLLPAESLSFDRVDNKKGYVKGNVVACRMDVNSLKNQLIEMEGSIFKDNLKLLKKCVDKWGG